MRITAASRFVFLLLGDQTFGGQDQAGDRRRVLQRGAHDLGRIDDALRDEVAVLAGRRVVAVAFAKRFDRVHDDAALLPGIFGDLAERLFDRAPHDVEADQLVAMSGSDRRARDLRIEQRDAAAGNDSLFHGRAGRVHGVLDARLLLFQFGLGRGADLDDGNAAGQFRQPLLQLLVVVVALGLLDLLLDQRDAAVDGGLVAVAVDDGGLVLGDHDALGAAELLDVDGSRA